MRNLSISDPAYTKLSLWSLNYLSLLALVSEKSKSYCSFAWNFGYAPHRESRKIGKSWLKFLSRDDHKKSSSTLMGIVNCWGRSLDDSSITRFFRAFWTQRDGQLTSKFQVSSRYKSEEFDNLSAVFDLTTSGSWLGELQVSAQSVYHSYVVRNKCRSTADTVEDLQTILISRT